jgi:hypothetical protein
MGGDSNPRNFLQFTRFPGVHNRPLCHPSSSDASRPCAATVPCGLESLPVPDGPASKIAHFFAGNQVLAMPGGRLGGTGNRPFSPAELLPKNDQADGRATAPGRLLVRAPERRAVIDHIGEARGGAAVDLHAPVKGRVIVAVAKDIRQIRAGCGKRIEPGIRF